MNKLRRMLGNLGDAFSEYGGKHGRMQESWGMVWYCGILCVLEEARFQKQESVAVAL